MAATISMLKGASNSPVTLARSEENIWIKRGLITVTLLFLGFFLFLPLAAVFAAALEKGFGKKPLYQREGGSIPIVVQFKELLGLDTVLLGFGLPDENAHAPDEFINLNNFFGGIRTSVHFFNELPNYLNGHRKK